MRLQTHSDKWRRDEVRLRDEIVPGLIELGAVYPEAQASAAVEFRTAAGPWRSSVGWIGGMGAVGGGDLGSFVFGDVRRNGPPPTDVSLAHVVGDDEIVRLVAVDKEGREHAGAGQLAYSGNLRMLTTTFDLPRERIDRFWVQVRALTTITMPDIALNPRPAGDPR